MSLPSKFAHLSVYQVWVLFALLIDNALASENAAARDVLISQLDKPDGQQIDFSSKPLADFLSMTGIGVERARTMKVGDFRTLCHGPFSCRGYMKPPSVEMVDAIVAMIASTDDWSDLSAFLDQCFGDLDRLTSWLVDEVVFQGLEHYEAGQSVYALVIESERLKTYGGEVDEYFDYQEEPILHFSTSLSMAIAGIEPMLERLSNDTKGRAIHPSMINVQIKDHDESVVSFSFIHSQPKTYKDVDWVNGQWSGKGVKTLHMIKHFPQPVASFIKRSMVETSLDF